MDYRNMAEAALRERAEIFEKRKALQSDEAKTDAEKREGFERMDADMDRLASEAREAVESGEREAETRDLMQAWWGMMVFGFGAAVVLAGILLFPRSGFRLISRLIRSEKVLGKLRFLQRLHTKQMLGYLLIAALRYGVYSTQFYLLVRAFMPDVSVVAGYAGVALTFFVKFIMPPVTLLDLGIREGAAVFFLGQLGIAEAAAFNAALLVFCINIMLPAIIGLPFIFKMRFRTGKAEGSQA